jgi:signal transduction histidine kinase/ActR/RegA family two-component response regulator
LEAGSMGVMRLYTTDREVEFDEQAADLCGVKQPPHTRQPLAVLQQVIHPGDRLRLAREYLRAVAHHAAFLTECRTLRDDGSVRWLVFRGGVLIDDGAQGAQLTAIITDITYRRQLEEQRLRSQKLESLGVLAGGIAHDFNNLLLAISGNLKLAMADLHEPHPAMASLREISKAASRAADLVRRILAFSRPQDHQREAVSLGAMLEEVLGLARAVLPASIAMRVFTPETSPIVLADATQIHQALINLLTNAADAVPAAGGEIEIHMEVVDIDAGMLAAEPQLQAGHRYARVTISDNGSGMGTATLQRIFDPFYTTKPLGQGTGLGLPIVHGIMKGHEGAVIVHSEVGRGTIFALYFPVHTTAVMPPTPVAALPSAGRQGHILYVDDEEALVYLMTRTLQRMGHQVTARTAPEQALAALMEDPDAFDLVVTDMSMPGMSGLELARKILAIRPHLPVVITTGFVRAEDYEAANAAGVRQLILKPNTIDELGATIQRVLQGQEVEASEK